MFSFSAPGEIPPLQLGNTHGPPPDIHQDIANTRTVVNSIHNMLKSQEATNHQSQSVSVTRTVPRWIHAYCYLDSKQVGHLNH